MWDEMMSRFGAMSTRYNSTDASAELITILAVSFILGFLCCYVQRKSKH